ncbi:MAG TPA: HEAT repeat domain-containing protein [Planctomycetes bacterium]|nr:HEAT repeat domain-containing protein [Planctomycetota bacterium]
MVDRLFVQEDEDFNLDRLKLVGAKAVPMLIEALENPKTAATKFGDGGHALDPKSPFERIVDLLTPIGAPSTAETPTRYVDHEDDHFRKFAAIALGNIGSSDCVAPMLKALDDDDEYVRSFAMMGIERGIGAERCAK